ncbi:TIGR00282 family metallophosphoesterase [Desertibaculum subflavum]|uniref:TIGR00282 family metallophosphoesterase n=1 Tax=Desertibaculum subflavum TaxID=2268458 RepID=UPI000E665911
MRVLYFGDVVGRAGRDALLAAQSDLRARLKPDFIIANGENAAGGFGITGKICEELYAAGIDVILLGNHAFDQRETLGYIGGDSKLLRPHNFPKAVPGRGAAIFKNGKGKRLGIIHVMGRVFMDPLDDPFASVAGELPKMTLGGSVDFLLVDIHAEATSEKMAMAHFCDGKATAVIGTHSHIPTADAQILPGGTAYQTDAGMCGDYNSVIGMDPAEPMNRFVRKVPGGKFEAALGPATVCGVLIDSDDATGLARRIEPIRLGGRLKAALPEA